MIVEELAYRVQIKTDEFLHGKKIVIQLVDEIDKSIDKLEKSTDKKTSKTGRMFTRISKSLKGVNKDLKVLGKTSKKSFKEMNTGLTKFLGITIGIAAVRGLIVSTTDRLVALGNASAFLNMSPQNLDGWQKLTQSVGGSAEEVTGILMRLQNARDQLTSPVPGGQIDYALNSFNAYTQADIFGSADPGEQLSRVAKGLRKLPLAQARNWARQIGITPPMFDMMLNPKNDNKLVQLQKNSDATQQNIDKARELKETLTQLSQTAQNLGADFLHIFGTDINNALKDFNGWMVDNQDGIRKFFETGVDWAHKLTDAVWGTSKAVEILLELYAGYKVGGIPGAIFSATVNPATNAVSNAVSGTSIGDWMNNTGIDFTPGKPWFYSRKPGGEPEQHTQSAKAHRASDTLMNAVALTESNGDPNAISPARAAGLMQLMPGTARDLGLTQDERFDPEKSYAAAQIYMSKLLKHYNGDVRLALMAYNGGPTRVDNWRAGKGDPLKKETIEYPGKVLSNYQNMMNYASLPHGARAQQSVDNSRTSATHINTVNVTTHPQTADALTQSIEEQARRSRMVASFSNGMY